MPKFGKEIYGMIKKYMAVGALLVPAALICLPVFLILTGSVMDSLEMKQYLLPVFGEGEGYIRWKLMPDYPTFEHYGRLLFMTPSFFVLFWNSVKMVLCILAGQLLVGVPAAWAFAAYSVRGSRALFALYVVLMLLPFQVMLLPQYIVLQKLHLYNHPAAVILPAIFSTFPVFIMYRGFTQIDAEILEAARLDGAGELQIFIRIGLPLGKMGIQAAMVLSFLEYWNLVEQPMAFLEEQAAWPLSLYLPQIGIGQAGFAFALAVVVLIPALFVFALGQDALEEGIAYIGVKT